MKIDFKLISDLEQNQKKTRKRLLDRFSNSREAWLFLRNEGIEISYNTVLNFMNGRLREGKVFESNLSLRNLIQVTKILDKK